MSFDINPLGPQSHLKQLEREARHQRLFENAAKSQRDAARTPVRPSASWVAWFASMFVTPRHAS